VGVNTCLPCSPLPPAEQSTTAAVLSTVVSKDDRGRSSRYRLPSSVPLNPKDHGSCFLTGNRQSDGLQLSALPLPAQAFSIPDLLAQARSNRSPLLPLIALKHQFSFPLSARIPLSPLSVLGSLSAPFVRVVSPVCFGCVGLASLSGRAVLGLPLGCLGLCRVLVCLLCLGFRVLGSPGGLRGAAGPGPSVGWLSRLGPAVWL
jgi:hypothetical protein